MIKREKNKKEVQEGKDVGYNFKNYHIKISQLYISLIDYNIQSKHLKIKLYVPNYDNIKQFKGLENNLRIMVMEVIGEIAFRKHIKYIDIDQLPQQKMVY